MFISLGTSSNRRNFVRSSRGVSPNAWVAVKSSDIAKQVREAGIDRQALIIVGDVLAARREGLKAKSLLYDEGFSHGFRGSVVV